MLNRNKKDINSYVNSNDLERYLSHLRFDHPFIYRHSELKDLTIDHLFRGNNHLENTVNGCDIHMQIQKSKPHFFLSKNPSRR